MWEVGDTWLLAIVTLGRFRGEADLIQVEEDVDAKRNEEPY